MLFADGTEIGLRSLHIFDLNLNAVPSISGPWILTCESFTEYTIFAGAHNCDQGNMTRILESIRIAKARGATMRVGPELEIT